MKRHRHRRTTKQLIATPVTKKGSPDRKIIGKLVGEDNGIRREYRLHATKGYRSGRP